MMPTRHTAMNAGVEFDAIRSLLDVWGDLAVDIGDDAAIIAPVAGHSLIVSTDACVEDVHFRRDWLSPDAVGVRATAAALSDLAAMGAAASSVLVAMVVPERWQQQLPDVARGIAHVVRAANARLVGGNMSRGDRFAITTTVIGHAANPIRRRGAQPGDAIVVTGRLGGAALAVAQLSRGHAPTPWVNARYAAPAPRLAEGQWLAERGAHAMIDLSDGLVADAGHVARASGVDILIDAHSVPRGDGVDMETGLASGEEYELLASIDAAGAESTCRAFQETFGLELTVIGAVTVAAGAGDVRLDAADTANPASRVEIRGGHDHFSR